MQAPGWLTLAEHDPVEDGSNITARPSAWLAHAVYWYCRAPMRVGELAGRDRVADDPVAPLRAVVGARPEERDRRVAQRRAGDVREVRAARARVVDELVAAAGLERAHVDVARRARPVRADVGDAARRQLRVLQRPGEAVELDERGRAVRARRRVADAQHVLVQPAMGLVADEGDLTAEDRRVALVPRGGGERVELLLDAAREAEAVEVAVGRRAAVRRRRRAARVHGVRRAAAVRAEVDVERVRARGDREALRRGAVARDDQVVVVRRRVEARPRDGAGPRGDLRRALLGGDRGGRGVGGRRERRDEERGERETPAGAPEEKRGARHADAW